MNLPSTVFDLGKYRVMRKLGEGAFGTVFYALDRTLNRHKAIKIMSISSPDEYLSQIQEAQILDQCRHKNIVAINEANVLDYTGHKLVLDLEFLPNGSLESEMRNRWISIKETIAHLKNVLSGLEYAHSLNFLHRDIKPANILLCDEGAKLSDFGLATLTTGLVGSGNGYTTHLAPEVFTSNITSKQTDIFAMGITLYRCVHNINDWRGIIASIPNARNRIHSGKLISYLGYSSLIPQKLKRIINKACNIDPSKRYKSALKMRQALDKLRYNIDWVKSTDYSWIGNDNSSNSYYSDIAQNGRGKSIVTFKKNNRRQRELCDTFDVFDDAVVYQEETIADQILL